MFAIKEDVALCLTCSHLFSRTTTKQKQKKQNNDIISSLCTVLPLDQCMLFSGITQRIGNVKSILAASVMSQGVPAESHSFCFIDH